MKLCDIGSAVYVDSTKYCDVFLWRDGEISIYEPSRIQARRERRAHLTPRYIAIGFDREISKLWFDDLSKKGRGA